MTWNTASILALAALIGCFFYLITADSFFGTGPVTITIQILAALLMAWARIAFGARSFHPGANPTSGGLVTTGPYRWLRHPIYASIFYFLWAGVAAHVSWLAVLAGLVASGALAVRMRGEETMLARKYPEYLAYTQRATRLVPFVFFLLSGVALSSLVPPAFCQFGSPGATYPINDINHQADSAKAQPITGKVRLEDGSVPTQPVLLVRVCNGLVRPGAFTDNKGRFSFRHRKDDVPADESASTREDAAARYTGGYEARLGSKRQKVAACELRAVLSGYRSDAVGIDNSRSDLTNVGTLLLHPTTGRGSLISITSLSAPPEARNAFESSWTESGAGKLEEAERRLQRAVDLYPRYASAWYELGTLQARRKDSAKARASFAKAIEADPDYTSPYDQLALLAAREDKWQEVSHTMDRLMILNPAGFPEGWLLDAISKFHLNNFDGASKSAQAGIQDDPAHRLPKLHLVMGLALSRKKQYREAAVYLADYLRFAPNAPDAGSVKAQLAQIDLHASDGTGPK